MRKTMDKDWFYKPVYARNFIDTIMTVEYDDIAKTAETRARQGKKNFLHVDILLKS
jgi:hypothetical protein